MRVLPKQKKAKLRKKIQTNQATQKTLTSDKAAQKKQKPAKEPGLRLVTKETLQPVELPASYAPDSQLCELSSILGRALVMQLSESLLLL